MYSKLLSVIWHITNRCNLECKYCYTDSNIKEEDLPTETMLRLVEQINETKVKHVSLIGGEPMLRADLHDIVMALDSHIAINLDTHGLFIPSRWHDDYDNKIHHVSISVDGSEFVHNSQRCGYKRVISAIEFLVARNISVASTITVTRANLDEVRETIEFLYSLGVTKVNVGRIRSMGRATRECSDQILSKDEANDLILQLKSLYKKYKHPRLQLNGWYTRSFFEDLEGKMFPSCLCAYTRCIIGHDGSIVPCELLVYPPASASKMPDFPNIESDNLLEIFKSSDLFLMFRQATSQYLPQKCSSCIYKARCDHNCRAEALLETGNIFGMGSTCEVDLPETVA